MNDIRHALRLLARHRPFAVLALATVAIGIGATTLMLSVVNAALLRPLPIHDPGRVVTLREWRGGALRSHFSLRQFVDYRDRNTAFSSVAAWQLDELSLREEAGARVVPAYAVSGGYFGMLGLRPAAGRLLQPGDDAAPGAAPVVVISHRFWQERFGGDPSIVGRASVTLNGAPLAIVGVGPEGFDGTFVGLAAIAWFPLSMYTTLHPGAEIHEGDNEVFLNLTGRLPDGMARTNAEAALALTGAQRERLRAVEQPVEGVKLERMNGLPPGATDAVGGFVLLLLAASTLLLVISSVNVAGMLLARAAGRGREIAVRLAIGAGRGKLFVQLLTESLVLFVLGGAAGALLAAWGADALERVNPPIPVQLTVDLGLDWRVLAIASFVTVLTGIVFGLAPAAHALRTGALSAVGRGEPIGGGRSRLRGVLVAGQLAVSLVLLVTAMLFVRALRTAVSIDPGFETRGIAVASIDLEPHGYDGAAAAAFHRTVLDRLEAAPGIESAALANVVPLGFSSQSNPIDIDGALPPAGQSSWSIDYNAVSPGWFELLGIPLVRGRDFGAADGPGTPRVVVINETMARRWWPGGDALGSRIARAGSALEIVGVVRDADYYALGEEPRPYMYVPMAQSARLQATLFARSSTGDAAAVLAAMRREIASLDADVPLIDARPLDQVLAIATFPQRTAAVFVGAFGIAGLLLAAVGIYGVLAFAVRARTREIGVRMALGATAADVASLVAREGLRLLVAGSLAGIVIALAVTRLLTSLLFGVHPADIVTYAVVTTLLFAIGTVAAIAPAARAARVDPLDAMRAD